MFSNNSITLVQKFLQKSNDLLDYISLGFISSLHKKQDTEKPGF